MLTLYCCPGLWGIADSNPFGLKVYAFFRLCGIPFRWQHRLEPGAAPLGQLPYIVIDGEAVGDSDTIIEHVMRHYGLTVDHALTTAQRCMHLLIRRTLDDLYWVTCYARWQDDRFWPAFRDAVLAQVPDVTPAIMDAERRRQILRCHVQGIGRFDAMAAYGRGVDDIDMLADLVPASGFMFGPAPTSIDAAFYGSIANIHFIEIDTPLRHAVAAHPDLVRHCESVHTLISGSRAVGSPLP